MKNEKHSDKSFDKTSAALLILFAFYLAAVPTAAFAAATASTVSKIDNQDDFDKKFREGRNLIDREEWASAAAKFHEAIEKYPQGKSADAALYWLAFCHKKQKQFKAADEALDRLIKDFPSSSWVADARVMRMEIAAPLKRIFPAAVGSANSIGGVPGLPAAAFPVKTVRGTGAAPPPPAGFGNFARGGVSAAAERNTPLDREDEIKIAAFQSLFAADQKRAIETLDEILQPDSKASEILKQEVLRVLRSPRWSRTETFAFNGSSGSAGVGKELLPLLRETLVKSFERETNFKIRREIIYALGNTGGDLTEHLKKIYAAADSDREIKKTVINLFNGAAAFSDPFNADAANGFYAINSGAAQTRKIGLSFLLEILRTEKDVDLRVLALGNLQRYQNWSANEQTIDVLMRLYDSETDEVLKTSIIRAFSSAKQNQAIQKLMDIAKNDKSDKFRLEAIYALRTSKNPEVLKFLEDLIK